MLSKFHLVLLLPLLMLTPAMARGGPYVNNGDGTVKDQHTGLVWQKCSVGQSNSDCSGGTFSQLNWQAALDYCNSLSLGGMSDWRLPNHKELLSLVWYGLPSPLIDSTAFPATISASSYYWTSTSHPSPFIDTGTGLPYRVSALVVYFLNGTTTDHDKATGLDRVRCVRGP